jgi:outer membrane protein TolC
MTSRRLFILFLAPFLLICPSLSGQSESGITLPAYLERIASDHPLFSRENLQLENARLSAEALRTEAWELSLSPAYSRSGEASTQITGMKSLQRAGGTAALSRSIRASGGALSFNLSSDFTRSEYGSPVGTSDSYLSSASVSYTQPLLKNLGGVLDRLGYELAREGLEATEIQSLENRELFLLDAGSRFLDWVLLQEQVRIAAERLSLAEEQLAQVERRYSANLVDRVDVLRAQDAVRSAEQGRLQRMSLYKARQAELAVLAQDPKLYERVPEFDLFATVDLPGPDADLAALKSDSRLLLPLHTAVALLARQRTGLVEQARPLLALTVAGGLAGADSADYLSSWELTEPDVTVSLWFSHTPGNHSIKRQIEALDAGLAALAEQVREVELELESALRGLRIQLTELEKILELGRAQIESAREKTAEELALYNQGRGQLTFVIQSRDNERNAQLNHAENAALYQSLLLQYRALMDELLPGTPEGGI